MKHKLYNRLLSLALALGLVVGMLPGMTFAGAVDTTAPQSQAEQIAEPTAKAGGDGKVSFSLPVKLYGDDGADLSGVKTVSIPIKDGETVRLPGDYINGIETISSGNKTYEFSYVADGMNGSEIEKLQAGTLTETKTSTDGGWYTQSWREETTTVTTYYIVWYGNKPASANASNIIASRSSSTSTTQRYERKWDWGWSDWYKVGQPTTTSTPLTEQENNKTIHFMYTKEGVLQPEKELTRTKTVTKNNNGTYDLTLTVSGAAGSITNPQELDVLFIFDRSNSMYGTRARNVQSAAKKLVTTLEDNETVDARYSIVTFYGSGSNQVDNEAEIHLQWAECQATGSYWNPSNNIADSIDSIQFPSSSWSGGTNYQAGIRKGITQLNSCRSGAQKVVVFLTDGLPTYRLGGGNGQNDNDGGNMNAAVSEIRKMYADAFYAIGVGDDFTKPNSKPVQNLQSLCENVNANQKKWFTVGDSGSSSDLEEIFQNIAGDAVSILCSDVTVTDTLSDNVEIVTNGGVTPDSNDFTITVVDESGEVVKSGNGQVTVDGAIISASYDSKTRRIILDFPDDYQLKKGYTYKVTTTIQATEEAYNTYRSSGNTYPNTGDQGTGTHAEQAGLYTNNKATVDYTYNGKNYSAEYPKPVIQLEPGTLTIQKTIEGGLTEKQIESLKNELTFTVSLNGEESSYKLKEFTKGQDNTYTLTISGLSPNTEYTVTESNADVAGYTLEATKQNDTGTVTKGGSATAQFVNDYQNTKNEYPVRFYLEGIKPGSAKDYPYSDAWAKLNSWLSGGFANVTTSQNPMTNFDSLEGEAGYDDSVSGGSVAGGIAGHANVAAWLEKYEVAPAIEVNDISAVLTELVKMYPEIENAPVVSVGGNQYTVNQIIKAPEDFQIVYTQVTQNHDQLLEYYKGNGSLQQGQDSYHVHLSVRKNPGNLTITKTFSGVESLPSNFAVEVTDSAGKLINTLTLDDASFDGNIYTWTLENLNEDTYAVTETGTNVENMVLSATINVTDNDTATPETVNKTTAKVKVADNETSTVAITNSYSAADGKLTITKKIEGDPATNGKPVFDFKITEIKEDVTEGTVYYVHIDMSNPETNNKELTLPAGNYKVEELGNLNYTQTAVEGLMDGIVKVGGSNQNVTVTFTNTADDTKIPSDSGATQNLPDWDDDGNLTWLKDEDLDGVADKTDSN